MVTPKNGILQEDSSVLGGWERHITVCPYRSFKWQGETGNL